MASTERYRETRGKKEKKKKKWNTQETQSISKESVNGDTLSKQVIGRIRKTKMRKNGK